MGRRTRALSGLVAAAVAVPALALAACEPAPPRPANDDFGAAQRLASAATGRISGTTLGANLQPREIALGTHSVWYHWVAPADGVVSFDTSAGLLGGAALAFTGSTYNTLRPIFGSSPFGGATFRATAGTAYSIQVSMQFGGSFSLSWEMSARPGNDNRQVAAPLSGSTGSLTVNTSAATRQPSDPLIDDERIPASVWYRWTAPADGWYAFDTSGSQADAVLGAYTDTPVLTRLSDSAGDCIDIGFGSGISTSGGASVGFAAQSGHTYLLMLGTQPDSFSTGGGSVPVADQLGGRLQLNWRAVPGGVPVAGNDAFASAATISGTHGSVIGTTVGATAEPGEPAHQGKPALSSVWYSWTPTVTADYLLQALPTGGAGCPSRVAIYSGTAVNHLTATPASARPSPFEQLLALETPDQLTADPLTQGFGGQRVHLVAGRTYHVAVDSFGEASPFALRWDIPQAVPAVRSITVGNGTVGVIWSPPAATAGSRRAGYYVTALPVDTSDEDMSGSIDESEVPVTSSFTTIHGLTNGKAYRVVVAAVNDAGPGDIYVSGPVTPRR
jgi:hypothetical protein